MSRRSVLANRNPRIVVRCRWMTRRDIMPVLAIERLSYGEAAWSAQHLMHYLRHKECIASVAEDKDGEIVGYIVYRLRREARQILGLAVHPKYRLCGVGRQLVEHLRGKIEVPGCRQHLITCYSPDANTGGHLFLRQCGFRCTGIVREFFEGGQDAYRFEMEREGTNSAALRVTSDQQGEKRW